jgi:hypothetical protein
VVVEWTRTLFSFGNVFQKVTSSNKIQSGPKSNNDKTGAYFLRLYYDTTASKEFLRESLFRLPTMTITLQQLCDLPSAIHPILTCEAWLCEDFGSNAALWQDLQPALRFATQMLTNNAALMWWTHLLYGQQRQDSQSGEWYLSNTMRSWNPTILGDVKEYLSHIAAGRITFVFSNSVGPAYGEATGNLERIHEILSPTTTYKGMLSFVRKHRQRKSVLVSLRMQFRDYFASGQRSGLQDLYTSFLLGITIVHEIAHAVYELNSQASFKSLASQRGLYDSCGHEPYFCQKDIRTPYPRDTAAELGWCLEKYLFGLEFHASITSQYGVRQLYHCSVTVDLDSNGNGMRGEQWTLTAPDSVLSFFKQRKWENVLKRWRSDPTQQRFLATPCWLYDRAYHAWAILIPNAALIDQWDGLYTYVLCASIRGRQPFCSCCLKPCNSSVSDNRMTQPASPPKVGNSTPRKWAGLSDQQQQPRGRSTSSSTTS